MIFGRASLLQVAMFIGQDHNFVLSCRNSQILSCWKRFFVTILDSSCYEGVFTNKTKMFLLVILVSFEKLLNHALKVDRLNLEVTTIVI